MEAFGSVHCRAQHLDLALGSGSEPILPSVKAQVVWSCLYISDVPVTVVFGCQKNDTKLGSDRKPVFSTVL